MNNFIIVALIAECIAAIGQVFLKKSAGKTAKREEVYKKFVNLNVVFGYSLFLISTFLNLIAYKHLDLKLMPAISSISFVYILLFSWFIFKEQLSRKQVIGMVIIILGIFISCM